MTDIQTLTAVTAAEAALNGLAEGHDWVSVFWDKRDRRTPEISIMVDGDGQDPKAYLTKEVYAALVDQRIVGENTYAGFHARRIHDFKTPPVPEKTGPTSNEIAEDLIRDLIATHPELPIVAAFFRGINRGNAWNPINEEIVGTPAAADGWRVYLKPGHSDVCLSAQEPTFLGPDIIGRGMADRLDYPTSGAEVDLQALAGPTFREQLLAAIVEKVAVIEATR
jgi:hypothetical protein